LEARRVEKVNIKEQEKQARKNAILDAALILFSEKDFHEVTVDEIAENVGLSKGTLYLYFENKEHLFLSIIQEKTKALFARIREAIQGDEPYEERLEKLIRAWLGFFEEHQHYFKIIHSEKSRIRIGADDLMRDHMMKSYLGYEQLLREFIQDGINKRFFREIHPDIIVKGLRGLLNSFTFQCVFFGRVKGLIDETPFLKDLFLYGVVRQSK
jgi:TetR/AcrR family transcriptional regulator